MTDTFAAICAERDKDKWLPTTKSKLSHKKYFSALNYSSFTFGNNFTNDRRIVEITMSGSLFICCTSIWYIHRTKYPPNELCTRIIRHAAFRWNIRCTLLTLRHPPHRGWFWYRSLLRVERFNQNERTYVMSRVWLADVAERNCGEFCEVFINKALGSYSNSLKILFLMNWKEDKKNWTGVILWLKSMQFFLRNCFQKSWKNIKIYRNLLKIL